MSDEVPEGWSAVSLGDICSFGGGSAFKEKYQGSKFGDYPFIKVSDMNLVGNERFISYASNWITKQQKDEAKIKLFPKDSVVFAKVGAALLLNRRRILLRETAIDNNMMAAIPSDSHRDYLYFLLQSISFGDFVQSGAVPSVNQNQLESVPIISPPLPEQKKIAAILTSVDEVIEKTEAQINKLQDLKKAMMQTLLTQGIGHTEFKESLVGRIPKEWSVVELGDVAVKKYGIVDGPFGSNLKTEHYRDSGIPVIQSGFVTSGIFKATEYVYVDQEKYKEQIRSSTSGGDIVMAKIGAKAGACALLPDEHPTGILAGNSLKITVDEKNAVREFVFHILHYYRNRGVLDNIRTETAQPAISIYSLKRLKIPFPSKEEQEKIAGSIDSFDRLLETQTAKLIQHRNLKRSLMQDLLTGKVRVKPNPD
jgi:type I restriction enzyme S subunit